MAVSGNIVYPPKTVYFCYENHDELLVEVGIFSDKATTSLVSQ